MGGVAGEDLLGLLLVDLKSGAQYGWIEVVVPLLNHRSPLDPLKEGVRVAHLEEEDPLDGDVLIEELDLGRCAGDPVEEKELLGGEIAVGGDEAVHIVVPDLYGDGVGEEVPFTGVLVIELASRGFGGEGAENVARREVAVVARAAQELTQGPFSCPRRAEEEEGAERLSMRRNQLFSCHSKLYPRRFPHENARKILQCVEA